jgi:hypothetical protein
LPVFGGKLADRLGTLRVGEVPQPHHAVVAGCGESAAVMGETGVACVARGVQLWSGSVASGAVQMPDPDLCAVHDDEAVAGVGEGQAVHHAPAGEEQPGQRGRPALGTRAVPLRLAPQSYDSLAGTGGQQTCVSRHGLDRLPGGPEQDGMGQS